MKSLVEKKGVDIAQIGKKIDGNINNSGNYDAFHDYLINQSLQILMKWLLMKNKSLGNGLWKGDGK